MDEPRKPVPKKKRSDGVKTPLYAACFALRNMLDPILHFTEISVLAYHSLSVDSSETSILPEIFEEHLRLFKKNGVTFVSVPEIIAWRRRIGTLPKKSLAITFDDGYADFETAALPLLEKYKVPVTLFVVGSEEASRKQLGNDQPLMTPEAFARVRNHPLVTIGYHTRSHANLIKMNRTEIDEEVAPPVPLEYFAFPGGNYSRTAIAAVHDAGYEAAFSIKPTLMSRNSPRYLLPRCVITRNLAPWEVVLRTTKAIAWYRACTRPI